MKKITTTLLSAFMMLSALATVGSDLINFGEYPVSRQKDCFAGSFGDYDTWVNTMVSRDKALRTEEDRQAARERLQKEIPAALHERYKARLTCNWFVYPMDGGVVRGYVIKPKAAQGKLPVIIYNRGGNLNFSGVMFGSMFERHFPYADEGFIVIGSQYRGTFFRNGSPGFSDQFGGDDVDDVLELLNIIPHIEGADSSKVAMVGGSRGAMQSFITLRRTDKIKAVAALAGVYDLEAELAWRPEMEEVYEARIPNYNNAKSEELAKRSVLHWVDELDENVPILLAHGQADQRTNPTNSLKLAQALQEKGHPYKLVIYPMGDHYFSLHQKEVNQLVVNWVREQLGTAPVEQ
jgi:dipeptidyl aminopeptidase/acylaminoacyl peptidase